MFVFLMIEKENFRSFAYRRTLAALGIAQTSLALLSFAQAFRVKICQAGVFIFFGGDFCFQFVSFGCFRFRGVLIINALDFGSRFSRSQS